MSQDWKDEAARDLEFSGLSLTQIAKKHNRCVATITKLLRQRNIKRQLTGKAGVQIADENKALSLIHRHVGMQITIFRGTTPFRDLIQNFAVSDYRLTRMETGQHEFTLTELIQIARDLDVSLDELVSYKPPRLKAVP